MNERLNYRSTEVDASGDIYKKGLEAREKAMSKGECPIQRLRGQTGAPSCAIVDGYSGFVCERSD